MNLVNYLPKISQKNFFSIKKGFLIVGIGLIGLVASFSAKAQINFANKTTANGLASNDVRNVHVSGNNVYAATDAGLSISTDGGNAFVNKTMAANGLASDATFSVLSSGNTIYVGTSAGLSRSTDGGNTFTTILNTTAPVRGIAVSGNNIYAGTTQMGGLSVSTDGGASFVQKTTADGLGGNNIWSVFASGNNVYVATNGGLSRSTDGGNTFTNKTTADGLGADFSRAVFVSGNNVYVGTNNGLSISTDGGNTFTNKTGAADDNLRGVFVSGDNIYVATQTGGLSKSTDGGNTFTNSTTANGLGSNTTRGVFVSGSNVYVATNGGLSIGEDPALIVLLPDPIPTLSQWGLMILGLLVLNLGCFFIRVQETQLL